MRQPCGKYGEYDLRVHLCAQPLDGSFGQPQGTLGLLALYRGMGAALQPRRCHGPEVPQKSCRTGLVFFVGGQQHGGGVAVARLRGPGQFFGSMQHGLPDLKIARVPEDLAILLDAHKAAEATLLSQGDLDFIRPILALQYKERFAHIMEN